VRPDPADPRVVDHDVEAPEVAHHRREGVVDLLPVRHVRRVRTRVDPGAPQLLGGELGRIRVHLEHRDPGAGGRELVGDPQAEPGSGAGHDRDSAVEHTHHAILASPGGVVKMTIVDSRC
jgi:hypothetical protein